MKAILVTALLWTGLVHAESIVTLKAGTAEKQGVNISTGATVKVDGKTHELATVGSGLRKKKVLIVPVKVYIAQLMVSDSARYVKTAPGALPSLDNESAVAMHLTFLRDVPASNLKEAFQAGLDANSVPATDPDIAAFMKKVDEVGGGEPNGSLTIFITKNADGTEALALENKGAATVLKSMVGQKGLTHKLMSIWLGNPADDYLGELKAEMMQ